MYDSLEEKILNEHNVYMNVLLLNSRADIISRTYEITVKTAIYNKLINSIDCVSAEKQKKMMLTDNLIDWLYLKMVTGRIVIENGELSDATWNQAMFWL